MMNTITAKWLLAAAYNRGNWPLCIVGWLILSEVSQSQKRAWAWTTTRRKCWKWIIRTVHKNYVSFLSVGGTTFSVFIRPKLYWFSNKLVSYVIDIKRSSLVIKLIEDPSSESYDEYFDLPMGSKCECPICLLGLREPVQTSCGTDSVEAALYVL